MVVGRELADEMVSLEIGRFRAILKGGTKTAWT
jgi:hypothetical protein